jgi:phosphatidyl-myo-inositol alpha-mannosyltransferase
MTGAALNIGMFTASLPEPDRKPGGVDILIDRVANQLVKRGHAVTIHTYSPEPAGALYAHRQLEPREWRTRKLRRMLAIPLALNRLDVREHDVLHLHGDDCFYWRRPIPTVRTYYGSALDEALHGTRWRRRLSQALAFSLELLSVPLATANYGLLPSARRVYRLAGSLGCGVDLGAGVPATATAGDAPYILFVGTWDGRKRGALLAHAFAREVKPRHPGARLLMVSDRIEPAPGVVHVPRPTDAELSALYDGASVFCLPSAYEGLGIPYLEAMAHGVPVVATPNPGAEALLDRGRAGCIVAPEDVGTTIADLLDHPERRDALARRGLGRAADFSWERTCEAYETAYVDAIARHGRSA